MIDLRNTKLIAFDLDDTLFLEREFNQTGFKIVADHLAGNDKSLADKMYAQMITLAEVGRRDIFQTIIRKFSLPFDQNKISELIELYRQSPRKLTLLPDAKEILNRLKRTDKLLGLITDGPVEMQENKVRSLNIERYFDKIIYTNEFGEEFQKPSTKPFELLENQLGVSGVDCVYIADNEQKDFAGANRLGWLTIKVIRADGIYTHSKAIDEEYKPKFIVDSLAEIVV